MDAAREGEQELEVPPYFRCPISMQLMRDPITLCTGITYERESMEKWLYVYRKNTCPITMQTLRDQNLTPNHTLHRLIQGWCAANVSTAHHPIPRPSPPIESRQVHKLLQQVLHSPNFEAINALSKLRGLVCDSEPNKRCIAAAGAIGVLISIVETFSAEIDRGECCNFDGARVCEEALAVLYHLLRNSAPRMEDEDGYEKLAYNWKCLSSMAWILKRGTSRARFHAVMLFHNLVIVRRTASREFLLKVSDDDILEGLLGLLTEEACHEATVSALEILMAICGAGTRNRIKAIEAGAVRVLIHSLPETIRRSSCERMLGLLDVLCGCAEGRSAVIDHAMGIAAVSNCVLRVSDVATEKAVRILCSICKFSPSPRVLHEMLQTGGVSKLCMVLQYPCTSKTRHRAKQLLRLHSNCWRKSLCLPLHLLTVYPSYH